MSLARFGFLEFLEFLRDSAPSAPRAEFYEDLQKENVI